MKTTIAILIALTFTACVDVGDNTKAPYPPTAVEQECGLPPDGPAYDAQHTVDATGTPIVIISEKQFDQRVAWESDMESWTLCALNVK